MERGKGTVAIRRWAHGGVSLTDSAIYHTVHDFAVEQSDRAVISKQRVGTEEKKKCEREVNPMHRPQCIQCGTTSTCRAWECKNWMNRRGPARQFATISPHALPPRAHHEPTTGLQYHAMIGPTWRTSTEHELPGPGDLSSRGWTSEEKIYSRYDEGGDPF